MSTSSVLVRYDGEALANHQMDVADLAPALLGISELCKIANRKFNGDRASVKVFIGTDQEHQCFQFSIDIVQTLWQQAQALIADNDIKSAKDIFEWIGILGGPIVGGAWGLIKLLKYLKNRSVTGTKFMVKDGRDVVQLEINGDSNNVVIVHRAAFEMLSDASAIANIKKIVEPLTQEGYETVEFEDKAGQKQEVVTKIDAQEIIAASAVTLPETDLDKPQQITAWVQVYAPVYDQGSQKWQFKYGERHESMDISETGIVSQALSRGGALIDDTYKVVLEIQQTKTAGGAIKNKFKIKKVLEFHGAQIRQQLNLLPNAETE